MTLFRSLSNLQTWQAEGGSESEAPAPGAEGPGEAPPPEPSPEVPPEVPSETLPPPIRDRKQERIDKLTARLRDAEAARDSLAARIRSGAEGPPEEGTLTEAEVERRAQALTAQRIYDQQCNDLVVRGRETFGTKEFDARIEGLKALPDPGDIKSVTAYTTLIQTCIETGEGDRILFELGADPDRAEDLLKLSPVKMALQLAKMTTGGKTPAEPSRAPKPMSPVGAKGPALTEVDPRDVERADKLSTAEWMRRRTAQLAKKS